MADDKVEAVVIATPSFLHHDQTIAAAAAGKHVLCEKPMALSTAACDEMIAACRRAGVLLMVGQSLRFVRPFAACLERVRRGDLGRLLGAHITLIGTPPRPSEANQPGLAAWKDDKAKSGGELFEFWVHHIDFLCAVCGQPLRASAQCSRLLLPADSADSDLLQVSLVCPQQRQAGLLGGDVAHELVQHYLVMGEQMTVQWFGWEPQLHITSAGSGETQILQLPGAAEGVAAELEAMCAAIRTDADVPVPGEEGRATIAALELISSAMNDLG